MVLIYAQNSFHEYLDSLSPSANKNWRYVKKRNSDLTYERVEYTERVEEYMKIWARQLVRGNPIEWSYPASHVENLWKDGKLLIFQSQLAMHFIEKKDGYWDCHPPMWDKAAEGDRCLGTWMWFKLVEYVTEHRLGILNLGGGPDSWREMIRNRGQYPNPRYKWRFVPQNVKDHPDDQPDYFIENGCLKIHLTN